MSYKKSIVCKNLKWKAGNSSFKKLLYSEMNINEFEKKAAIMFCFLCTINYMKKLKPVAKSLILMNFYSRKNSIAQC